MSTEPWVEPAKQYPRADAHETLSEIVAAIRRDRWWIAGGFAVPMLASIIVAFATTPKYEATSTLLVRFGREYVYNAVAPGGENSQPMSFDRDQMVHSESAILTSKEVIDQVLHDAGLARVYPKIAAAAQRRKVDPVPLAAQELSKHLNAQLERDSDVMEVTFDHPDSKIAADVVNKTVLAYLARRRAVFSTSQSQFLEGELAQMRGQLTKADNALTTFEREHGIVSFDHQMSLLLDERQALDLRVAAAKEDRAAASATQKSLESSLATIPSTEELYTETSPGQALVAARQRLLDLQMKQRDLTSRFFDNDPLVADVRKDIATTQAFIAEQERLGNTTRRTGRNDTRDAMEADLIRAKGNDAAAAARQTSMQAQLDDVDHRIGALDATRTQHEDLERAQKLIADTYSAYSRQLQDAIADDAANQKAQTSVSIIQRATAPINPKSLRGVIIGLGFALSVFTALVVAFAVGLARNTFTVPESLERALGLPVLGVFPYVKPGQSNQPNQRNRP